MSGGVRYPPEPGDPDGLARTRGVTQPWRGAAPVDDSDVSRSLG
jgi:hypothetical protein